jgi:hypothetical protein
MSILSLLAYFGNLATDLPDKSARGRTSGTIEREEPTLALVGQPQSIPSFSTIPSRSNKLAI